MRVGGLTNILTEFSHDLGTGRKGHAADTRQVRGPFQLPVADKCFMKLSECHYTVWLSACIRTERLESERVLV